MPWQSKREKKYSTRQYNNRTVYDCFNNTFPSYCAIPDLNLPPITIYDRPLMDKQARYIPDLLQSAISVASENSINTFTTPYDSPQLILLTSDDPNHHHAMKKYETYHVSMERGY